MTLASPKYCGRTHPTEQPLISTHIRGQWWGKCRIGVAILLAVSVRQTLPVCTADERQTIKNAPTENAPTEIKAVVRVPDAKPVAVGMNADRLAVIDDIVADGLRFQKMRGCVVVVGHRGQVVHRKAYGARSVEPTHEPMTIDTLFDLASLTKPIVTAMSVMRLVESEKIALDDRVQQHLGEFNGDGKEAITIQQLLTHQGGLIADNALADYLDGRQIAWQKICDLEPVVEPGTKFIYSDVGFIVLGELVERVSGQSLDEFARQTIFDPLDMQQTRFNPPKDWHARCAPTERSAGHWRRGTVHDPRAREWGGVAGHAGLFSTGDDLALFCRALLDNNLPEEARLLKPKTFEMMTQSHETTGGLRALGWDKRSVYSSNRGDLMTPQAFGHGGFTGTALWIDPGLDLFVIFLSSRLHPDGKGRVNTLAGRIATVAAAAIIE